MTARFIAVLTVALATSSHATEFRLSGSLAGEGRATPLNASSPLNRGNVAGIEETSAGADVSVLAGAAADSRRWRVHLRARAETSTDGTDAAEVSEGYVQWNATPWLDVTAGRVIEKWGTGYAWNPVAFIGPAKNPADPSDRRSTNRGRDMIKADVAVQGSTISLFAVDGGVWAARAYRLIGDTDVAIHLRSDGAHTDQGLSVARVFGDALELHGEVASGRAVVGGHYTFGSGTNVMVELYRNGDGLGSNGWNAFERRVSEARDERSLRDAWAMYAPMSMGRHYAFVRLSRNFVNSGTSIEAISITNLRDRSTLVRLSVTRSLHDRASLFMLHTEFAGRSGSELSYMPVTRSTIAGVRLWF